MSSLYYSGDTGTNRGMSLRRPWDMRRRAQIRSDVLHQAAEDLVNKQAQVERRDPLSRDKRTSECGILVGVACCPSCRSPLYLPLHTSC
jgi:hypothetical protein